MNENPLTLEEAAKAAFASAKSRTAIFNWQGQPYVAKRLAEKPRKLLQTLFVRWLVQRITGLSLPMGTLALSEAARSVDFETNRLQALAQAGIRVPRIALKAADFFVLDYCGPVVATLLEQWSCAIWREELTQLAAELGVFHRVGQWHGGAQIKNITLLEGKSYRIDFEENFGQFLPLPVTQLNDLLIFLNSVSLAGPVDEAESKILLPRLIEAYFRENPDEEIRQLILRILPLLNTLARWIRPLQRGSRKGIRRILILVELLSQQATPSRA